MTDTFAIEVAGRVNLIGDHTDYQAGLALPFALDGLTLRLEGRRGGEEVVLHSGSDGGARYADAVLRALADAGHATVGFDATISSSLPIGAGLSSSAALEIAVALAACVDELEPLELARICQRAENEYVGVPCGLLDQLAIVNGAAGEALLLDFGELEAEWRARAGQSGEGVEQPGRAGPRGGGAEMAAGIERLAWPERLGVLVVHSGVERQLGDGAYALRRAETEQAALLLGVGTLRELDPDGLEEATRGLPEVLQRRVHHVVSENARVRAVATALRDEDDETFGRALGESHRSLSKDFEVSTPELDLLVELLAALPGTLGARLTGAGFGGCAIAVVRDSFDRDALDAALAEYERRSGCLLRWWRTAPGQGVRSRRPPT